VPYTAVNWCCLLVLKSRKEISGLNLGTPNCMNLHHEHLPHAGGHRGSRCRSSSSLHKRTRLVKRLCNVFPPPMLRHFVHSSGSITRLSTATFRSFSANPSHSQSSASAVVDWSKFYETTSTPEALAAVQKKRRRFFPTLGGDSALVSLSCPLKKPTCCSKYRVLC
jgi:hypothetical protein